LVGQEHITFFKNLYVTLYPYGHVTKYCSRASVVNYFKVYVTWMLIGLQYLKVVAFGIVGAPYRLAGYICLFENVGLWIGIITKSCSKWQKERVYRNLNAK